MAFPTGDVNNYVVGSEEGAVYTASRHGRLVDYCFTSQCTTWGHLLLVSSGTTTITVYCYSVIFTTFLFISYNSHIIIIKASFSNVLFHEVFANKSVPKLKKKQQLINSIFAF